MLLAGMHVSVPGSSLRVWPRDRDLDYVEVWESEYPDRVRRYAVHLAHTCGINGRLVRDPTVDILASAEDVESHPKGPGILGPNQIGQFADSGHTDASGFIPISSVTVLTSSQGSPRL